MHYSVFASLVSCKNLQHRQTRQLQVRDGKNEKERIQKRGENGNRKIRE